MKKEPFSFSYTQPSLDWYRTINVVIKQDDYCYFKVERRFGPSWWLIGSNPEEKPNYHWKDTQIGEISDSELKRFIEWAKGDRGSRIIEFKAISGEFNIIEEIMKLTK